ncbi:Conidial yellow pigment biosynthesis polyketide synthase [Purpureocillium lavendulum]|uniref:Conidial yellow pigment biosynthesis polyketide synthase n=1 Tax=Purpureocillium lavendulum TaxID=1247861 RepID=A0AB34FV61_9HYPO|nr:Conidial yellow pigment biosynthesis polyketide synthase [Purpureocillium lavendulum]
MAPMTCAQIRQVIATIGQLFPHIPYAVCGHAAMSYYGSTPLKQPSYVSLVCPPDCVDALLKWAVAKGLSLCDRWPATTMATATATTTGAASSSSGGGGGFFSSFCVPTTPDGVERAVRVHRCTAYFSGHMRSVPAPDAHGASVLTLPCIADAVAVEYLRAARADDYRVLVLCAKDVFWLLRRMAALRGADERQALTPRRAPTFASARFLEAFTEMHVYSVDLMYNAGLDLARVADLTLPLPPRVGRTRTEERTYPSARGTVHVLPERRRQRVRSIPRAAESADAGAGYDTDDYDDSSRRSRQHDDSGPDSGAKVARITRQPSQSFETQPCSPQDQGRWQRQRQRQRQRHQTTSSTTQEQQHREPRKIPSTVHQPKHHRTAARPPRARERLVRVGHFLRAAARFRLFGEMHRLKKQLSVLEGLGALRISGPSSRPGTRVEDDDDDDAPPSIWKPNAVSPQGLCSPEQSSAAQSLSSARRTIQFDRAALSSGKPHPRRRSCYAARPRPRPGRAGASASAGSACLSKTPRPAESSMPLSMLGSLRRSRVWPSVKADATTMIDSSSSSSLSSSTTSSPDDSESGDFRASDSASSGTDERF